jgi:hypothetical protein
MQITVDERVVMGAQRIVSVHPDPGYVSFVAKVQKAKTRKGREYFVLRVTVPKEASEQLEAKPEDFLLFKTKKAQWYHMMNWNEVTNAWGMLPSDIKQEIILSGLPNPEATEPLRIIAGSQASLATSGLATSTASQIPATPMAVSNVKIGAT